MKPFPILIKRSRARRTPLMPGLILELRDLLWVKSMSPRNVTARDHNFPEQCRGTLQFSLVLLLTGRWKEGWQEYEWRWTLEHFSSRRRNFPQPLWDGTPLPNGTLLLHAEQGLGDAIQCARYVALAKEKCARVVVECHPPLRPLFESLDGADVVVATGDSLPSFEAHAPFMSLPGVFGTTPESIPQPDSYLSAPADIAPPSSIVRHATPPHRAGLGGLSRQ